jgi:ribulose-phosphate 3-epimerase
MVANPQDYLQAFVKAGADIVTVHAEAVPDVGPLLDRIHELGASTGLAINPDTPVSSIERYLDRCDLALVMSVNAGFGGQAFNPVALEKLRQIRRLAGDRICLEVDGGVNASTITECAEAGAELFVVGSAIFRQPEYGAAVARLRELAQSV